MVDTESLVIEAIERSERSIKTLRSELNKLADRYGADEIRSHLNSINWKRDEFAQLAYEINLKGGMGGMLDIEASYSGLKIEQQWIKLPFKEAIESFLDKPVLTKSEFEQLSDAHKRRAFTVANMVDEYAVDQIKQIADEAMREGWSKGKFIKKVRESHQKYGFGKSEKYHLETVFRTNVQTSFQNGRWKQLRKPSMMQRRPYWKYITADDPRVRPAHAAMAGKIYPADHSIWNIWFPPNGYNCRCNVEALPASEAKNVEDRWPVDDGSGDLLKPDLGFSASPEI